MNEPANKTTVIVTDSLHEKTDYIANKLQPHSNGVKWRTNMVHADIRTILWKEGVK